MRVYLFRFSKKNNSTKQPNMNDGVVFDNFRLKDGTSVKSPLLEFKGNIENPFQYNYLYIQDFNRYYFAGDWSYYRGVWSVSCVNDPLATFKDKIGETTCSIARCASPIAYDPSIIDNMYPISPVISVLTRSRLLGDFARTPYQGGYFIVGILNGNSVTGACQYYLLTPRAYYATVTYLMRLSPYNFFDSLSVKANPLQYIDSVKWIPLQENIIEIMGYEPVNSVFLYQPKGEEAAVTLALDPATQGQSYIAVDDAAVPDHGMFMYWETELPEITTTDPIWVKANNYRYTLTAPYLGTVDLPAEIMAYNPTLWLRYRIDVQSSTAVVVLSDTQYSYDFLSNDNVEKFYDGMIQTWSVDFGTYSRYGIRENNTADVIMQAISSLTSVNLLGGGFVKPLSTKEAIEAQPMADSVDDHMRNVNNAARAVVSSEALSTIEYVQNIPKPKVAGAIGSVLSSYSSGSAVRGTSGSYVDNMDRITITCYARGLAVAEDVDNLGRPSPLSAKIRFLGAYEDSPTERSSGFIKCRTAPLEFSYVDGDAVADADEIGAIQSTMLNGFYFE